MVAAQHQPAGAAVNEIELLRRKECDDGIDRSIGRSVLLPMKFINERSILIIEIWISVFERRVAGFWHSTRIYESDLIYLTQQRNRPKAI